MKKNRLLKNFVYGILIRRLTLAAFVIATVFSIITYDRASNIIINTVAKISNLKIDMIRGQFRELMKKGDVETKEALRQAVHYPPGSRIRIKEGHYVYAMIYDNAGQTLDAYEDDSYVGLNAVKKYISTIPASYPQTDKLEYSVLEIADRSYIYTNIRLIAEAEHAPIYLHAVFALSDHAIAMVRQKIMTTIL